MAQTPANYLSDDDTVFYTPSSAVVAGDVVLLGAIVCIAKHAIAANILGKLDVEGVFNVPKITGAITVGAPVFWNATADPVTGTAGSGAAQATPTGGTLMGFATLAAASGDSYVPVELCAGRSLGITPRIKTATVAAAGTLQADAASITEGFTLVSGAANAGVKLPLAVAGLQVIIKNNIAGDLKVWPATGDGINAVAVNSAFVVATLTSCLLVAYDSTTWFSVPLVAS